MGKRRNYDTTSSSSSVSCDSEPRYRDKRCRRMNAAQTLHTNAQTTNERIKYLEEIIRGMTENQVILTPSDVTPQQVSFIKYAANCISAFNPVDKKLTISKWVRTKQIG